MTAATRLSALRDIAWEAWDPIGLKDAGCPRDEYDTYLLHVAALLKAGGQRGEAVDYLVDIESDHMGLGIKLTTRKRAEETVGRIAGYIEAGADGDA